MVEQDVYLDNLFGSLADPVRRDILRRLMAARLTVSQLAQEYDISFAAVAKHLNVLEKATLIRKERRGREKLVSIAPEAVKDASYYLNQYEQLWTDRFDRMEAVIERMEGEENAKR